MPELWIKRVSPPTLSTCCSLCPQRAPIVLKVVKDSRAALREQAIGAVFCYTSARPRIKHHAG